MHKAEATTYLSTLMTTQGPKVVVGRGRDPERFASMIVGGNSVIFFGAPGFGKSHLAEAVDARLRSRGLTIIKLRGSRGNQSTPLAALRRALELAPSPADGESAITAASVLDYLTRKSGEDQPIVAVDDAHLLDTQTAEILCHLAADHSISLVLTSLPVPARTSPDFSTETIRLLTSLWIQGKAERVDLEALTPAEADELIDSYAPGEVFDSVTRIALYERSAGSPLLLRELTAEVLRSRFLLEDRDTISPGVAAPSGRLLDLLRMQLSLLSSEQLHGLALLGRVNSLAHTHSLSIFSAADLRDLLHRGFVFRSLDGEDRIRAHTVYAEAALTMSDPCALDLLSAQLAQTLLAGQHGGRVLSEIECVIIAEHWVGLESLQTEIDQWGPAVVGQVMVAAAYHCNCNGISDSGLTIGRRAYELEPTTATVVEYARALANMKQYNQALALLPEAEHHLADPKAAVSLLHRWSALALREPVGSDALRVLADRAETWFPDSAMVQGEIAYVRMTDMLRGMDRLGAARLGERIARTESFPSELRARAAYTSALEFAFQGDTARAQDLLTVAEIASVRHAATQFDGVDEDLTTMAVITETRVNMLTGYDLESVSVRLNDRIRHVVQSQKYKHLGYLAVVAAQLSEFRGDTAAATADLQAAEARFLRCDEMAWLPMVQCLLARSLSSAGRTQEAVVKLRDATASAANLGPNEWTRFITECAAIEILNSTDDTSAPRAVSTAVAKELESGGPVIHAWLLYDVFLHGETALDVVDTIETAAANTDLPLLAAAAKHVRAAAEHNAGALDLVAASFAALGAYGYAATAGNHAANLHRDAGDRASAALSKSRAAGYTASAHGTASVDSSNEASAPGRLTGRESEVALLAARGMSNRDIARALFLSVRTVESHLYQARVKLGAASRRDLGVLLGAQAVG
ncbi:MAG: Regulatory protein luxR family [Glaciihabitans sp.]|nr:Regulatory protein luxR family [Glaciihabitans sp.]